MDMPGTDPGRGGKADEFGDATAGRGLPGEFEPVGDLLLGWDAFYADELLHIIEATAPHVDRITVVALNRSHATEQACAFIEGRTRLADLGIPADHLPWGALEVPPQCTNTREIHSTTFPNLTYWAIRDHVGTSFDATSYNPWVRDWGPLVVEIASGPQIEDFAYRHDAFIFEEANPQLATRWQVPLRAQFEPGQDDYLEGGNVLSNGVGTCIATRQLLDSYGDEAAVRRRLEARLGCTTLVLIPQLQPVGDIAGRTAYIDMLATFVDTRTVLLTQMSGDPERYGAAAEFVRTNRPILETARAQLEAVGLEVVELPFPQINWSTARDPYDGRALEARFFPTYANTIVVNGVVLIPSYREWVSVEERARVQTTFEAAYPDKVVIPIDMRRPIVDGGALHCLTMTVEQRLSRTFGN